MRSLIQVCFLYIIDAMGKIKEKARAKINLSLDVIGKRADGYHLLRTIMQTVELSDTIIIGCGGSGINLTCSNPELPKGEGNTAFRAASLMCRKYNIVEGLKIEIEKNIPVSAGLAGGSTDAAAVLRGINRLFGMGLKRGELAELGRLAGADVPFCIAGGTVLAEGIGEVLTPLEPLPSAHVLLVNPGLEISTAQVYSEFRPGKAGKHPDTGLLVDAVGRKDLKTVAENMINVLETVTAGRHPVIADIKAEMIKLGAMGSLMSGSGPTVFGIFGSRPDALRALRSMEHKGYQGILTQMTYEGSGKWQENCQG